MSLSQSKRQGQRLEKVMNQSLSQRGLRFNMVSPNRYTGVELDADFIILAREKFSDHIFSKKMPDLEQKFDTIVSLAVIERVKG